jgi:hypothetical protein
VPEELHDPPAVDTSVSRPNPRPMTRLPPTPREAVTLNLEPRQATGGAVLEPDDGLAFLPVLSVGARRLEHAHLALLHQLLVAHPQVVDQLFAVLCLLPLAAGTGASKLLVDMKKRV